MIGPAIHIEGLGKRYRKSPTLYIQNPTLREALAGVPRRLLRRGEVAAADSSHEFWALRDVLLDVGQGECLGIIGRNGAGKTTLLKILTRVILPSKGFADVYGRVGALLAVGVGFHPDLSGRENVFLNAAVLGIGRDRIAARFGEIVEFAEIGDFIDTPVKRYSSGMYVRLAFSIATHIDPDILIIDEVLSVGDLGFQRKSMARIHELMGEGRTVLLVSHSMEIIRSSADRVLWLEAGRVKAVGEPERICGQYQRSFEGC